MMKFKSAALILCLILLFVCTTSAENAPAFTREEIVEKTVLEMEADGDNALGAKLRANDSYRTMVHRWADPDEESVRGETWYVRFDALDKQSEASYLAGLNEDGELRWLDMEPAGKDRAALGPAHVNAVQTRYSGQYGPMMEWDQAVWMSFATEARKGSADTRNAWRIQHASFVPVPDDAISREEAKRIALEAAGMPSEADAMCVCLEDGERLIFKVSLTTGHGWEHMVEMDCFTGEVLKSIPFKMGVHSWADCCVPDSVTQAVPPAEDLMTNG